MNLHRYLLVILAACLASLASAGIYNVRDFGAVGDGNAKDTVAFQKALDTCAVNGGGEVVVPASRFLIGSVQIGDRTILRLEPESVIVGSPDLADYPLCEVRWEGRWQIGRRGLIYASAVANTGIIGSGRIEGASWGTNSPDGTRNPVVIEPISCDNVRWEGFTVQQGGHWATHPTYCTNVVIRNLTITGKRDGIDVDSCRNVVIDSCTINAGDDCISLKSGRGMDGARLGRATEDVLITNCTLVGGRFACVGIGSETSGGVRNVRMENCRMTARTHAIYIKTRIGRGGVNENIFGDNLEIIDSNFLRINLVVGGNNSTADDPVPGLAGYPTGRNFRFTNVKMTNGKTLVTASEVSAVKPLRGLTLANITGTCTSGIVLANMTEVELKDIKVTGLTGPLLRTYNVSGTGLEGAEPLPAPVDPPPGNAAGRAPTVAPSATPAVAPQK